MARGSPLSVTLLANVLVGYTGVDRLFAGAIYSGLLKFILFIVFMPFAILWNIVDTVTLIATSNFIGFPVKFGYETPGLILGVKIFAGLFALFFLCASIAGIVYHYQNRSKSAGPLKPVAGATQEREEAKKQMADANAHAGRDHSHDDHKAMSEIDDDLEDVVPVGSDEDGAFLQQHVVLEVTDDEAFSDMGSITDMEPNDEDEDEENDNDNWLEMGM